MPPEGPLIGSGMKELIAEAAIRADMEHRGYTDVGGGVFERDFSTGAQGHVRGTIRVQDGSVEWEVSPDHGESHAQRLADAAASLQGEVFDYWPGAIDDVFTSWEDAPSSSSLRGDQAYAESGISEIRLIGDMDSDTGSVSSGNTRLASDLSNLSSETELLSGEYIEAFNDNYAHPLGPAIQNVYALSEVLAFGLAGEAELFDRIRTQISDLAWRSKTAMEGSGPSGGGGDAALALVVVGAVLAGIATVATGGSALAIIAGLGSAGAGVASAVVDDAGDQSEQSPEENDLSAGDPRSVLANMEEAIETIRQQVRREEDLLSDILTDARTLTEATQSAGAFNVRRPDIIDHTGSDVLSPEQSVRVNERSIAKITELWIPTINGDLNLCANRLTLSSGSWTRPTGIGYAPTGPWSDFSRLQSAVVDLLVDITTELSGAAQSLQDAAALIGLADEQENAQYAAQATQINDDNVNTSG